MAALVNVIVSVNVIVQALAPDPVDVVLLAVPVQPVNCVPCVDALNSLVVIDVMSVPMFDNTEITCPAVGYFLP